MLEFTGERVIPGAVEPDLFNEHFARYAFGARLTKGKRVLDAGCGDGYGAAELARDASQVIGLDLSGEAVAHARARYAAPNLEFRQGACASLPFPEACFDLVVAFEVIEHLDDPRALVAEARRVLAPGGAFLVSTPNKTVYAKTRGDFGPNPFHVREFDLAEFEAELGALFPHVRIFQQVDVSAILFGPAVALEARLDASPALSEEAHFFLGVCSASPLESIPGFLYLPRAGNLLHSRQRHIELLE
ncbi:MAG: class I SAM-dependent methyltransferase, partial [Acidobacteria bacterium]|nr:class I SAM-dependent methyltransferase [Acidobacteriota bacterium]